MRKIKIISLLLLLCGCSLSNNNQLDHFTTNENQLPIVSDELDDWKESTMDSLEELYQVSIVDCIEEENSITFYFDKESNPESLKIESVTYFIENPDFKITSFSEWSDELIDVDVDMIENEDIDISLDYEVETKASIKKEYQMVSYYSESNEWICNVQVGRIEYWYYQTCMQDMNVYHYDNIPNVKENNWNEAIEKDHYNDIEWLLNKSLEIKNSKLEYINIFE